MTYPANPDFEAPDAAREWSVQAPWILPGASAPIRDGIILGRGSVILQVGPADEIPKAPHHERLEGLAILPGFVNAHTHLELSGLRGQMPRNVPMREWLLALLRRRPDRAGQIQAVADGVKECLATGTTALGDISFNNASAAVLAGLPIRAVAFAEVLGIGPNEHDAMARLGESLEGLAEGPRLRHGISPHAPYSTSPAVYRQAVEVARQRGWPIMTHLAETSGEREFLLTGGGRLLTMLRQLGVTSTSLAVSGCGPVEFAARLGLLEADCILAHVNDLQDAELDMLAAGRASVAYCPRSSRFFGRSGHRYAEMIGRGVNVAVGTDSLASNDSLDMLAELRLLAGEGLLDDSTVLNMGTIHGARALGWAAQIGSLESSKQADWIAVEVGQGPNPLREILHDQGAVRRTVVAGEIVFA